MTREEYLKTVEAVPEGEREKLISIFDENEKNKSLKIEAFKERDLIKGEKKALEDAKATAEAEAQKEQGKYKELYETESTKATNLSKELETFKPFKENYEKLETERRAELIDRVKDDEDLLNHAKSIKDIDELTSFVNVASKKLAEGKKPTDGGRGGKGKFKLNGQKYDDLTVQQRRELEKESPDEYKRLFNERFPHSKI